jgi:hypothetical protein
VPIAETPLAGLAAAAAGRAPPSLADDAKARLTAEA